MPTTIQGLVKIRKGTSSGLASIVLLDGELGWATDTGELKVGNGTSAFSALTAGYYTKSELNGGQLNNIYYTKSEVYTKSKVYTKAEVQAIINGLITKINNLMVEGYPDISNIDNSGLF